ncbi:hypothetical protein CDD80_5415 [Ophiocordyceps camponoti-rufipedis]|uniref:Phosphoserine phosphatase n=1 Tax=Ophiocordyceps camponoti-rufipedis TaxID=2004952 RepID=A0A2C5YUP5_9HYPO|nr:hypothetical protein CDD80_5415 [Ophiocordyceps camponoti-rufipedis]
MEPVIRARLDNLLGEDTWDIRIVSNDIRPRYPDRPVLVYAGDGVSDISAARETGLLFAKADKELLAYCEREEVPFVTFRNWMSITQTCEDIVAGTITVQDAARGRL